MDRISSEPGTNRTMDPDIKHPRMRQGIVGIERELVADLSVGATGIWRKNDQFIDDVLRHAAVGVLDVDAAGPRSRWRRSARRRGTAQ